MSLRSSPPCSAASVAGEATTFLRHQERAYMLSSLSSTATTMRRDAIAMSAGGKLRLRTGNRRESGKREEGNVVVVVVGMVETYNGMRKQGVGASVLGFGGLVEPVTVECRGFVICCGRFSYDALG